MRKLQAISPTAFALAIVLLALGLRLVSLTRNGLWIDEASSVAISSLPVRDLITASSMDPHPPTYYLVLQAWMGVFGNSEFAVRLLSVFAGVLTVSVSYRLGARLLGVRPGLLAAWWLALSPALVEYSQETRMYALLGLWSVLMVWLALRLGDQLRSRGRLAVLAYGLIGATGLYVHYYFAFVLLAVNLWMIGRCWSRRDWQWLIRWLLLQGAIAVPFIPWIPFFLYQMRNFVFTWLPRPTGIDALNTLTYLMIGWRRLAEGVALAAAAILCAMAAVTLYRLLKQRNRAEITLLISWAILPLLVSYIISQNRPVFLNRQFLLSTPALAMLAAGSFTGRRRAALLAAILPLIVWTPLNSLYFEGRKQEWRQLAAYIQSTAGASDVIYMNPAGGQAALSYYLKLPIPIEGYPPGYSILLDGFQGEKATAENVDRLLSPLAESHHRIWLIQFVAGYWDPEKHIPTWLEQHAVQEDTPSFWGIDVRRYRFAP